MNLRRLLHPIDLDVVEGYREMAPGRTFRESMAWLVKQLGVKVELTSGSFLPSGPQLILSNHIGPLDGPILFSLIDRADLNFIGLQGWTVLGEEAAARLLPVYLSYKPSPHLLERLKNRYFFPRREGVTRDEAQRRNRESVDRAAKHLSEGTTLVLFPTGGTFFDTKKWKSGLGHIMAKLDRQDIAVIFVKVSGSCRRDLVRLVNPRLLPFGRAEKAVRVAVHEPIPLRDFTAGETDPRKMSYRVRDRYLEVFGTLKG